jgi:UDP-N-acetylglucosamine--dolichyl-phosphate N-acetylglucosaminephosphotransferase
MLFLGFADDVLDLRWRYKLILPFFASLPMLLAYQGKTGVVIPKPLQTFFGAKFAELGIFYKFYMLNVSIFASNSINIYAGINGLEAGQSLIIGLAVIIHNAIELNGEFAHQHFFSLVLIIPFVFVTLGLLKYNWYPSEVFVGDTFTYFAGITLAVAGILGHFSKTLMLFFIPQWLNFLVSLPQLVTPFWFPCPRHRLPIYDEATKKLRASENFTVINFTLKLIGPTNERTLCIILLMFQVLCCAFGFYVRYHLSTLFYDQ